MKDGWIQHDELRECTGWSDRKVERFAASGKVSWRLSESRRPNGRRPREYQIASLPTALQAMLIQADSVDGRADEAQLAASPAIASLTPIVALSDEEQKRARGRWSIIAPILDYSRLVTKAERISWCFERKRYVASRDELIAQIAKEQGKAASTLYDWIKKFGEGGFGALARKGRSDKGNSRWMGADERNRELAEIAAYAYLEEKLSKQMAWEIACAEARQRNLAEPSYETIRMLLEDIPAPIRTYALKGRRKYNEIFAPYLRRGYTDIAAGEIIVSDHAIHDVLVQNDLFGACGREHMRLRFTGMLCMRSRKLVAYAWSEEGSSRSITTCLRNTITRFGLFRTLYCDNGHDFQKVGRGAEGGAWSANEIAPETLGVLARLGIGVQHCIKFHPQSKLIERLNNTMHQRFDRRFITYCGPTPEQRPDRCIVALERHNKLLSEGRPDSSDLPLASVFIRAAVAWIEGEYNQRAKDVPGMDGLTPNEAFDKFQWAAQPAAPAPEELIPLLAERAQCAVRECAIQLRGRRYQPANEIDWQRMHNCTTGSVLVAYDPLDTDQVAAIDADGRLICTLVPEPLLRQSSDEETSAAIAVSMETRGMLRRSVREDLASLGRRVRSTGYVPQHEQMLALGRQPIDIGSIVVERPQAARRKSANDEPENRLLPGEGADRLVARLLRRA